MTRESDVSKPVAISTFSGPGGSSLGYERAGFDVRVAVDCAPGDFLNAILDTYRANHDGTLLDQDIRETTGAELLDEAGVEHGELDLLDGSPPCSPFSTANSRTDWREHESRTLFDEFVRLVDETHPKVVVAENVPQLAEGKTRGYFNLLTKRLRDAGPGYHLRVQKIDAAYLGAPQHRRRLMFMAVRSDLSDSKPEPITPTSRPMTVRDAWDGVESTPEQIHDAFALLMKSDNYAAYKRVKPGDTLADIAGRGWTHYRMKWTEPAQTFTSHQLTLHPDDDRVITIPELKRLVSLPDDYHIPTSVGWTGQFELCIRCLPPVMNEACARSVAKAGGIQLP